MDPVSFASTSTLRKENQEQTPWLAITSQKEPILANTGQMDPVRKRGAKKAQFLPFFTLGTCSKAIWPEFSSPSCYFLWHQTCSKWIKLVRNASNLIKLVQTWSNWSKMDQTCPKWVKLVQKGTKFFNRIKLVQIWPLVALFLFGIPSFLYQ